MKIDRIYSLTPVQKKRRTGCWVAALFLLMAILTGFLLLNIYLMPSKEADPASILELARRSNASVWDGYLLLDISADAPHGPALITNLLTMSAIASESQLDSDKIQSLQQLIFYPRVHGFMQSAPDSEEERTLVMLSLKRMTSMVEKLVDQTLTDVPSYDAAAPAESENPPVFQRLQVKNVAFISNYSPFLKALKDGGSLEQMSSETVTAGAAENANAGSANAASFDTLYQNLPKEGLLNGFILNQNGRLKKMADLLKYSPNDDVYHLIAEGVDIHYPALWTDVEWLTFQARAMNANQLQCKVVLMMKNRLEAVRAEKFLKEQYFPRLIKGTEGKVVSDVAVSREDYQITAAFTVTLNYLKYVIDSVQ